MAVECSSELPGAAIGDGPILRVGDLGRVFSPSLTADCRTVAENLAKRDKSFRYQRKLMDGGMCESTAYCELGYDATGVCFALGNYHNVDVKRKRLAREFIDLHDFDNVVKWFVELARSPHRYTGRDEGIRRQLRDVEVTYRPLLRASRRSAR